MSHLKCLSQNVSVKMSHSKCYIQNVSLTMSHSRCFTHFFTKKVPLSSRFARTLCSRILGDIKYTTLKINNSGFIPLRDPALRPNHPLFAHSKCESNHPTSTKHLLSNQRSSLLTNTKYFAKPV